MFIFDRFDVFEKNGEQLKKKKEKSSSAIGELIVGPSASPSVDRVNQSYSLVDYFPMKAGGTAVSTEDSSADTYFNPSEYFPQSSSSVQTKPASTSQIIDIPITFIKK